MATLAFRSRSTEASGRKATIAGPPAGKETLAIVSVRNKLCGIAAYTAALERQLSDAFDVTVFDLDQYLLRSPHFRLRKLGDRHIQEICAAITGFDAVNLQLEHGTLGLHGIDIYRRFGWLAAAAPRLSVTFHTLLEPPVFDALTFAKVLLGLKFQAAYRMHKSYRRHNLLSIGLTRRLRQMQRVKPVSAIVHNRRDLADAKYLFGIDNVFDHPLAFLGNTAAEAIRAGASRRALPILDTLPSDSVLIGVFGFLNEYKGFGTAMQALYHLPENYHLLIFGGTHPNEIAPRQPIHPYIGSLFNDAHIDAKPFDQVTTFGARNAPPVVLPADAWLGALLRKHPRDLSDRVHFMGALSDDDFLTGMALCNAVVFPYLEVGQSSSGPISQALELGCRIIASRTRTFLGFGEYHKDAIEFFDIGNHLELAGRILARPQFAVPRRFPEFNIETNKAVYLLANTFSPGAAGAGSVMTRRRARVPANAGRRR